MSRHHSCSVCVTQVSVSAALASQFLVVSWHEVTDKLDVFFDDALSTSWVVLIWDSLSVLRLLVSEPRVIL